MESKALLRAAAAAVGGGVQEVRNEGGGRGHPADRDARRRQVVQGHAHPRMTQDLLKGRPVRGPHRKTFVDEILAFWKKIN